MGLPISNKFEFGNFINCYHLILLNGLFCKSDSAAHPEVLEERLQDSFGILVDQAWDALDSATTSKTMETELVILWQLSWRTLRCNFMPVFRVLYPVSTILNYFYFQWWFLYRISSLCINTRNKFRQCSYDFSIYITYNYFNGVCFIM